MVRDGGVERAVRLHVGDAAAHGRRHGDQRAELVLDLRLQGRRVDVHREPPEALVVAIAGVGADGDALRDGGRERRADALGAARVEAARHVGAGDDVEHRLVVADDAVGDVLPEVRVEVDPSHGHAPMPMNLKIGPTESMPMYQLSAVARMPTTSSHTGYW